MLETYPEILFTLWITHRDQGFFSNQHHSSLRSFFVQNMAPESERMHQKDYATEYLKVLVVWLCRSPTHASTSACVNPTRPQAYLSLRNERRITPYSRELNGPVSYSFFTPFHSFKRNRKRPRSDRNTRILEKYSSADQPHRIKRS